LKYVNFLRNNSWSKPWNLYKFKISAWAEISGSKRGHIQVKEDIQ